MTVLETFRLDGKVAVVTGGAGLYGRQIVRALAEASARVVVASRNVGKLREFEQSLQSQGLKLAGTFPLDQSDEKSILGLRDQVVSQFGRAQVLVNNAVLRPMRDWNGSAGQFAASMAVNATGLFLITRAFGEAMASDGAGGSIINVGSIQGSVGPDFSLYEGLDWSTPPDYFFHKGGVLQLTRFAAAKLGPRGVRVNAVSPGGFLAGQDEVFIKRYQARTFLGRMADDNDLGGVIVFLASDAARYITGANIPVDGGYTAK
jgi:NAD(P)-dependent dehydrogenase (short-subunit alcohol dehydrogenase family)